MRPELILASLRRIGEQGAWLAMAWHFAIAAAIACLLFGWRPSRRGLMLLLTAPLATVSAMAFGFGNPFNGTLFALLTIGLVILAITVRSRAPLGAAPRWQRLVGGGLILFGLAYPHFAVGPALLDRLLAAPLGTLPCPTLAFVAGATLYAEGFDRPAWSWTLAVATALYGLVGVFVLHVWIDVPLFVAVGLLILQAVRARRGLARRLDMRVDEAGRDGEELSALRKSCG